MRRGRSRSCARAIVGTAEAAPARALEKFPPPHGRPLGSGDGIVTAQTPALIGAKPAFANAMSNAGSLIDPSTA